MADEEEKRPSYDREWWENLFGIYRDERIDNINLRAGRYAFYIIAVQLLLVGGLAIYFGDWQGWVTLGVWLVAIAYLVIRYRQLAVDGMDEWATLQLDKQLMLVGSVLLLLPVAFGIFTVSTLDTAVWTSTIILPIFTVTAVQIRQSAYPWQTWALASVLAVVGGLYGFQLGAGNMSPTVAWGLGIVYAILVIASMIYYFRQ